MTCRVLETRGISCKTVKLNYAQKPYPNYSPPSAKTSSKVGNLIIAILVLTSPYFLKPKIRDSVEALTVKHKSKLHRLKI